MTVLVAFALVPPADAALPLKTFACGQKVKKSVRLNNDLTCAGDGLVIARNNITLDLNQHTLTGNGTGNGINNGSGKDDVTIKNGTVQNFNEGVKIGGTNSAIATGNTVRKITALNNVEDGIDVDTGSGHRLINNTTSNNTEGGIEGDMNGSLVKGNIGNNNGIDGVDVDGNRNVFRRNTMTNNSGGGIQTEGRRNLVEDNTSSGNVLDGVEVEGNKNVVLDNDATGNSDEGLHVQGNGNVVKGGNSASGNITHGIEINGNGNLVRSNQASGNDVNGIFVEAGAGNRIFSNTANNNGLPNPGDDIGLGIDAQADTGPVQGSGNTATGNDNPLECVPDICLP